MFIRAPYGKFTLKKWGPAINPKAGWFIMELPAVLIPLYFFLHSGRITNPYSLLFIAVWELHYFQRTFIYPFRLSSGSHGMPIAILVFSGFFNLINGTINGYGVFTLGGIGGTTADIIRIIFGCLIFFSGFIINLHSDHILRNLRAPGESGYKIPQEGLFRYVCSPNYLGEIIEWTGWAVMTLTPASAAFLLFTAANLVPRAVANLRWYRSEFPDFPPARKAIIPGIL